MCGEFEMQSVSLVKKAIRLRELGYSYSMISQMLGLAKSTLNYWLKNIPYSPNEEVLMRIKLAHAKSAEAAHARKMADIVGVKDMAKRELGRLSKRDLWLLGIGLYLGEGSKLHENARIINANPEIIKLAIQWFRKICGLKMTNFSLSIHTYPDNDVRETLNYWSKVTGLPREQFGKTQVDKRSDKKLKHKGKLPYGTAHLTIKAMGSKEFGVRLHRRIMGWIEATFGQINAGVVQW